MGVLLVLEVHAVNGPFAVPFGIVVESLSILAEGYHSLLLRSEGDTAGVRQVRGSGVYVAAQHKGYFLAVGRYVHADWTAAESTPDMFFLILILTKGDGNSRRLAAGTQGVEVAVPAESHGTVGGYAQKPYRVLFEVGNLAAVAAPDIGVAAPVIDLGFIHNRAVRASPAGSSPLGKVVPAAVGCPHGVAVFAREAGELGECRAVLKPDVLGDGGSMMLAEVVFVAFHVFVEEDTFIVDREGGHVEREDLLRGRKGLAGRSCLHRPCQRQAVELAVARKDAAASILLDVGGEIQSAVGSYRERGFPASERGETQRRAAVNRNSPDIFAALAPRGEDHILSVGAPHRLGIVGRVCGELTGLAAFSGNDEQVSLIHENDL